MKEFQRKRSVKQYLYSPLVLIVLAIVFVVISRTTLGIYQKERQSNQDLALLTQKYQDLSTKSDYLNSEIQRLSTDRGIDQEIRDKFGVTKGDEKMVVIVEPDKNSQGSSSPSSLNLWQRFVNFFR